MKPILTVTAVLLLLLTKCSPYKNVTAMEYPVPFQFTLIDSVKGSKNDLYVKANEWMAKTFTSAKDVIQMQDKEAGKIIGKGSFGIPLIEAPSVIEYVKFTISIDVKGEKYRCIISNLEHETLPTLKYRAPSYGSLDSKTVPFRMDDGFDEHYEKKFYFMKNEASARSREMLEELKQAMHKKSDW